MQHNAARIGPKRGGLPGACTGFAECCLPLKVTVARPGRLVGMCWADGCDDGGSCACVSVCVSLACVGSLWLVRVFALCVVGLECSASKCLVVLILLCCCSCAWCVASLCN